MMDLGAHLFKSQPVSPVQEIPPPAVREPGGPRHLRGALKPLSPATPFRCIFLDKEIVCVI